jgi:protein-export membrane protein SecD
MFISRGSGESKTANQTFKLTYMESRATHIKDRISVNNIEYPIYPGFSITIKKGSTYKVHSDDHKSYRVWSKKNIYNISNTLESGFLEKIVKYSGFSNLWEWVFSDESTTDLAASLGFGRNLVKGIDLQGGSYFLLDFDVEYLIEEKLKDLKQELKQQLNISNLEIEKKTISFTITDLQKTKVEKILKKIDYYINEKITYEIINEKCTIKFSEEFLTEKTYKGFKQSLTTIRNRINELGLISLPTVQQQGKKRILVLLPGIKDPYDHKDHMRVKSLLGQIAKLTFHLVDENNNDDLKNNTPPDNRIILPDKDDENKKYLLHKKIAVSGENLKNAQLSFDQNDLPAVKFSFDQIGARKFREITTKNIEKRLAIVLDGVVISAPIIQSAILGGKGQISGNFTTSEATDLALLLGAGVLPAPLKIIEERFISTSLAEENLKVGSYITLLSIIAVLTPMFIRFGVFNGIFISVFLFINLAIWVIMFKLLQATITRSAIYGLVLSMPIIITRIITVFNSINNKINPTRYLIFSFLINLLSMGPLFNLNNHANKAFSISVSMSNCVSFITTYRFYKYQLNNKYLLSNIDRFSSKNNGAQNILSNIFNLSIINYKPYVLSIFGILFLVSIVGLMTKGLNFGIEFKGGSEFLVEDNQKKQINIENYRDFLSKQNFSDIQLEESRGGARLSAPFKNQPPLSHEKLTQIIQKYNQINKINKYNLIKIYYNKEVADENLKDLLIPTFSFLIINSIAYSLHFNIKIGLLSTLTQIINTVLSLGIFTWFRSTLEFNSISINSILLMITYSLNNLYPYFKKIDINPNTKLIQSDIFPDQKNGMLLIILVIYIVTLLEDSGDNNVYHIPLLISFFVSKFSTRLPLLLN